MSKQKKYHYIYKTTCTVTGKFYVGMHSTDNLEDGYIGSGKILGYSRAKYGDENHVREIVEYCEDRKSLAEREREIVNEDLLKDPLNINLKYGGEGGQTSESSLLGWVNLERRTLASNRLKNEWTDDSFRTKMSLLSSERMKILHLNGKIKHDTFSGKKHSEETKIKIAKSVSIAQMGEKNSQYKVKRFGVSLDGVYKNVLANDLQKYLDLGWIKGRKISRQK